MNGGKQVFFPPFTLDISNQHLQCGPKKILLRPKSLAVLAHLAEHPHRLISKEDLLSVVWPGAKVVDAALRVSIQEIRKALGDDSNEPKFIETVGKKGYRFIAPISLRLPEAGGESSLAFVGRSAELDQLRHHLEIANSGKRQVVLVTGEPGIGKTTLVEAFVKALLVGLGVIAAVGLCVEQFGAGEAYLPILDLLERMGKSPGACAILDDLRQYAPSWLASLPMLVNLADRNELVRQTIGTTPERRLREMASFLENISEAQTIVLVLEDLHWADPSTLALISFLARRREAARLMIIGTYREDEVERSNHPLKHIKAELQAHNDWIHLPLKLLPQSAVGEYLAARFETQAVPKPLLSTVYDRSKGNPLFMVNMTDYLVDKETIAKENGSIIFLPTAEPDTVPEAIRGLIERQVAALSQQDRELLELGAVAGMTFSVAVMARVLNSTREEMEEKYRELMERTHYLQYAGLRIRPNGRGSPRYSFVHALYQNVIYDRVRPAQRRRLHQKIGARIETAYDGATDDVAAELALHFERAGDYERAIRYLIQAAQKATRQSAYQEALGYSKNGLEILKSLPDNRQKTEIELNLQILLSVSLASSRGYAAAEVSEAYERANLLCQKVRDESLRMQALLGLFTFYLMSGKPRRALDFGKQMILAAQSIKNRTSLGDGYTCTGLALFYTGEYVPAQDHFDRARAAYGVANRTHETADESDYLDYLLTYTAANVWLQGYSATNLWVLGYPERAEKQIEQATFLMPQLSHPLSLVMNQVMLASYYQCRSDARQTLKLSDEAIKSAREYGIHHWLTGATMCKGWALANLGNLEDGIALLREGLKNWRLIGTKTEATRFITLLAEGCLMSNRTKEGLSLIAEALQLIEETEDRLFQSEVFRIRGELLKTQKTRCGNGAACAESQANFLRAIEIARRQKAKSFELRASISLARLWIKTGKEKQAKRMLTRIYGWFTEGFDTPDLQQAKALLVELG